ncbi:MAG: penicillin-binding transpeptidase domain-containing protein [Defluviitaleaceae bacterium]|nr:penicillin-binding transpeptidase domain-containing protein [Defluviitaleaceae bacterium]
MNKREDSYKAPLHERRRNRRAVLMGVFFSVCLLGVLGRIWYWQEIHSERDLIFEATRTQARTAAVHDSVNAQRGEITDRNAVTIALSRPVYDVFVDVRLAVERPNPRGRDLLQETITALHEAFDIPEAQLAAIFARDADGDLINNTHEYFIMREVPHSIARPLGDNPRLPDVHARAHTLRWHADPFFAPHVIGFQWGDSFHGLELAYNAELTGAPGRMFTDIDNHGNPILASYGVRHGYTLVTTLDMEIQRAAQAIVDRTYRDIASLQVGLIALNPNTGEILAMAQAPTFSLAEPGNPSYFTNPAMRAGWEHICEDERLGRRLSTWTNFHINYSFEPGSIFKPFVIAAALEEGVINESDTFFCGGHINIADRTVYCWNRRGHGSLCLSGVMYRSCNVAMAEINRRLGRYSFYRYRGYFGFGERTGIDLPGEFDLSSPAVMYPLHQLGPVQMATSSIGQGFNTTTIQSITAFASLINGGNLMQPFIVSQIVDTGGNFVHQNFPTVVRRTISEETADFVRRDMQQVVTAAGGTGRSSAIPGHAIGGKTGSAQQGRGGANEGLTLSYIAYTPVENPEIVVMMTIDHVEDRQLSSGSTVAPIVREFFLEVIQIRSMRPSEGYAYENGQLVLPGNEPMPDFTGRRVTDVVQNLNNLNLNFEIIGRGTVVDRHIPHAGMTMPRDTPVFIYLDPESDTYENMVIVPDVVGLSFDQASTMLGQTFLTAVLASSGGAGNYDTGEFTPGTADSVEREPGSSDAPILNIYRQFPAPGTEVERGFQVRLIADR